MTNYESKYSSISLSDFEKVNWENDIIILYPKSHKYSIRIGVSVAEKISINEENTINYVRKIVPFGAEINNQGQKKSISTLDADRFYKMAVILLDILDNIKALITTEDYWTEHAKNSVIKLSEEYPNLIPTCSITRNIVEKEGSFGYSFPEVTINKKARV